jgi:hypothetical protein
MAETALVPPRRVSLAITWFLRVVVAAYFLNVGTRKLMGATMWVTIFEQIGAGQWFRYLTGSVQVIGALLLLTSRGFLIGAGLLACTMAGAILAWTFVLYEPHSAVLPAIVLAILAATIWVSRLRGRTRT